MQVLVITVSFTTNTAGQVSIWCRSTPEDMVRYKCPRHTKFNCNIYLKCQLTLTESNGNTIAIYNVTNDANNKPFVGAGNIDQDCRQQQMHQEHKDLILEELMAVKY